MEEVSPKLPPLSLFRYPRRRQPFLPDLRHRNFLRAGFYIPPSLVAKMYVLLPLLS